MGGLTTRSLLVEALCGGRLPKEPQGLCPLLLLSLGICARITPWRHHHARLPLRLPLALAAAIGRWAGFLNCDVQP
jgi:hypothetical protein